MKKFDIKKIIYQLSNERKIFESKADFQRSLASEIEKSYPSYDVFLKQPVFEDDHKYDIVLQKDEKIIPIELIYKTKELEYDSFNLKTHGAKDLACYDYLNDISKIESLSGNLKFEKGFSIFLTNDLGYLNEPRPTAGYKEFSIHDGRTIFKNNSLNWGELIGEGTRKGREDAITLKFNHRFIWNDYSYLNSKSSNDEFKYLLTEIRNENWEIFGKERFMLSPSGMHVRDMKHLESYKSIDDIIDVMNMANESDNRAIDMILKEFSQQEDKNVVMVLERILDSI